VSEDELLAMISSLVGHRRPSTSSATRARLLRSPRSGRLRAIHRSGRPPSRTAPLRSPLATATERFARRTSRSPVIPRRWSSRPRLRQPRPAVPGSDTLDVARSPTALASVGIHYCSERHSALWGSRDRALLRRRRAWRGRPASGCGGAAARPARLDLSRGDGEPARDRNVLSETRGDFRSAGPHPDAGGILACSRAFEPYREVTPALADTVLAPGNDLRRLSRCPSSSRR